MLAAGAGTLWAGSNIRNYKQQVRPCSVRGCTSIVFKQLIPNVSEVRAAHVLEKQQTKLKSPPHYKVGRTSAFQAWLKKS